MQQQTFSTIVRSSTDYFIRFQILRDENHQLLVTRLLPANMQPIQRSHKYTLATGTSRTFIHVEQIRHVGVVHDTNTKFQ
jgi:hypothetical protein